MSTIRQTAEWTDMSTRLGDHPGMPAVPDKSKTKKPSRTLAVFSDNLSRLMRQKPETDTTSKVALLTRGKLSYKTIERIVKQEHEPTIETVEAIAKVFGLEPWQMLIPGLQPGDMPALQRSVLVEA